MNDKERFICEVNSAIHRHGINDLMERLEHTDFYSAPCSTSYHLCVEGGLVKHSLNVYDRLVSLCLVNDMRIDRETIAIVSLFHDLCKADTYTRGIRWKKADGKWESYETYEHNEKFTYGHGEKSVYLLSRYIAVLPEEAQAIRYHMGAWMEGEIRSAGNAFSANKLAVLLHIADMMATYLDEGE